MRRQQTILQQCYIAVRQRPFVRRQMKVCAVTPDLSGAAWREVLVIGETQRRCHERSVHHQISRWVAGQCLTERQALQKAAELFDTYGPDSEIEIYLNELSAESILYSREWMRQWNGLRLGHR